MIYVTGDTHGDIDWGKLNTKNFPEQNELTINDYVIILGDFGGVWSGDRKDNFILDWYEKKSFTTLYIGGNHENWQVLNAYPVEEWNGGKIHRIRPHVIHLMNGQVFTIEGKTFFVMGGATSKDKAYRKEGISWWTEEEPSDLDYKEAEANLSMMGYSVDYVLTHTVPRYIYDRIGKPHLTNSRVEDYLNQLLAQLKYKQWFAGHLHEDMSIPRFKLWLMYKGYTEISSEIEELSLNELFERKTNNND